MNSNRVHTEIEEYTTNINTILGKLEAVESSAAFQGTGIKNALVTFITVVKDVSVRYTNALKESEKQIISEVKRVYAQQDTDVSGNLSSDSATLQQNNTFGS